MSPKDNNKALFYTSTNLENDLSNKSILNNVIITNPLLKTIKALMIASDKKQSKTAALSVVGPFGSGKSTSVLVGYHYLRGTLPTALQKALSTNNIPILKKSFRKEEIKVITGVKKSLIGHLKQKLKIKNDLEDSISKRIQKGNRLVLIIDEFGKYLEYNADNPKEGDVYVLQQLAELSQRSKGNFILITIRHQALSAYFSSVKTSYLNEWKKIQGRFSDLIHTASVNETLALFGSFNTSRFSDLKNLTTPKLVMECFSDNNSISIKDAEPILKESYPVHPFVLLIMISGFKRFAQNERSLFTFLDSNGRHSIREFLLESKKGRVYGLSELYDYISANMKYNLLESDISSDWGMIDNAINNLDLDSNDITKKEYTQLINTIKTLGIIQVLGKEVGFTANPKTIQAALHCDFNINRASTVKKLLDILIRKNILTYKKLFDSYLIWEGTDINLNILIDHQTSQLPKGVRQSPYLKKYFPVKPMIAQRHYVEKGTLRWANFEFCEIDDMLTRPTDDADGVIRCAIVNHDYQKKEIEKQLHKRKEELDKINNVIPMVLMIGHKAQDDLRTLIAINELLESNHKIQRDKIARKELKRYLDDYYQQLIELFISQKKYSSKFYLWKNDSFERIKWYSLNKELSNTFDIIYKNTPKIHNELINKQFPSPSANVGVRKFLIHLNNNPKDPYLGIEGNGPEKSIYLNVLQKTGLHRKNGTSFSLEKPNNDDSLELLWSKWEALIKKSDKEYIIFDQLEKLAMEAPFGIKQGLARVLASIKLFQNLTHVSLYKIDGVFETETFVEQITDDMIDMLMHRPHLFRIKYVKTEKIHQNLFNELYRFLEEDKKDMITLLDIVKPLIKFVNDRSIYTKSTNSLGESYHNVIQCISKSISPENLVYKEIPVALGLDLVTEKSTQKEIKNYVESLKNWHQQVQFFDEGIIDRMHDQFKVQWGIPSKSNLADTYKYMHNQITDDVDSFIIDFQLKEFSKRVRNKVEDKKIWFESLASALGGARVQNWNDADYNLFIERIKNYRVRIDEAIELARKNDLKRTYNSKGTKGLQNKIIKLLDEEGADDNKNIAALIRVQEEIEKRVKEK